MHARRVRAVRVRKAAVARRVRVGYRGKVAAIVRKAAVHAHRVMAAHRAGGHMVAAAIARATAEPRLSLTAQSSRPMVRIYHNSRCSKSRATLALLEQRVGACEVIHYLDTPPDTAELTVLLKQLGMSARELLRSGEAEYQSLGLDDLALDDAALIAAMVAHPKLIERPIVGANGKAAIGRPPEAVLAIL